MLNIEEVLGNSHQVFQVDCPSQHHLDRQAGHEQDQDRQGHVAQQACLLGVFLEEELPHQLGENGKVKQAEYQAGSLADQDPGRLGRAQKLDPDDVGQVDVVQRNQLVQVPVLVGAEEIPVWAAQKRAQQDEHYPEYEEPILERDVGELALGDRVVAAAFLVGVDVGNGHEPDD